MKHPSETAVTLPALATPASPLTDAELPGIISAQWQRAGAGLVEIIRFGALMVKVDKGLSQPQKRGGSYNGQTLKGWLSEHCPEINYNTARGYRDAALGLAAAAELPSTMPLLALMDGETAFEPERQAAQEKVLAILGTASIGFLKAASRRGGKREGAGRPRKAVADPMAELTDALLTANKLLSNLRTWALDDDGLGALPDDVLSDWLLHLGDVSKRGRDILAGRKIASKARSN